MRSIVRLVVTLTLAGIFSVAGAQSHQFAFAFAEFGSGNGQLNTPDDSATDAAGNIYVVDGLNHRVQKFDRRGVYLDQWGGLGSAPGQFRQPIGIAVDSGGDVFVVEFLGERVQRFDADGNFISAFGSPGTGNGQFNRPAGIAAGPDGRIYVSDRANHRIQVFENDGTFVRVIGSRGSALGQFEAPNGITVTAGNQLYVADRGNDRIQRFNSSGTALTTFGASGTDPGQFNGPFDVAVDADGDVLVVDQDTTRIQVFGFDGAFKSQFGLPGSQPVPFVQPRGVSVDGNGRVLIVDRDDGRVQLFVKRAEFEVRNQNNNTDEFFARSMDVDGQLVAFGAPGRSGGIGAVDIYRREGDQLVFEEEIVVPVAFSTSEFGTSVDIQGDVLVVGAPGDTGAKGNPLRAAIFQRLSFGWDFKASFGSTQQTVNDRFGAAVAISGNMVAIGAPQDGGGLGAVYLFQVDPSAAVQEISRIPPPQIGPGGKGITVGGFGASLAFTKGRLAAGAPGIPGVVAGSVALFNQVANNLNPVVVSGSDSVNDSFGDSVSLAGESMLVGAPGDGNDQGAAFFFGLGGASIFKAPIVPAGLPAGARFGDAVALLSTRALIGSPGTSFFPKGGSTGASFAFGLGALGVTSESSDIPPANTCTRRSGAKGCGAVDSFGESAALDGGVALIGAPQAFTNEGTAFATVDTLTLFGGNFEGERSPFEN